MIGTVLSLALFQAVSQQPVADPALAGPAVDLGDIVVEGRQLEDIASRFVGEVADPVRHRGLARWRDGVCVGVANLQPDMAQQMVDRISTIVEDVGLTPGAPGCSPNILVIATVDANRFTPQFVAQRPRLFLVGGSGMDQGTAALDRFRTTDRPVRWWTVSIKTDDDTGKASVRLPGAMNADGTGPFSVMHYAPIVNVRAASRLTTSYVDDAKRSFVIVDVDKVQGISLDQLADYVAMVSLAQIDADADTSGYATILNVFEDPGQTPGLTNWDRAYLVGLYDTQRRRLNRTSQRTEVVDSIVRAHHRLTATEPTE
ncbi:hypothetical protein [Brevundimonas variabilis]|uniref:Uncharacterized protein n=1 Tax=Brevundimonas variabilis TaxID=74312 RepID=A0A7W9CHT1_9CAUL|nr:hypothetical protein [Brevundimonas variabilis]MBB5745834.1 hypothetical protein [Brevundimonas variabilis]